MNLIKTASNNLIYDLKNKGFVVHQYKAVNTNSVYLKLDWGAGGTIRISDHPSKEHLKYKYNVLKGYSTRKIKYDPKQYFFPIVSFSGLSKIILNEKENKLDEFGIKNYGLFMIDNKIHRNLCKGFWSRANRI